MSIHRTTSAPPDVVNPTMEDVWSKIQKLYDVNAAGERASADEWLQTHQVSWRLAWDSLIAIIIPVGEFQEGCSSNAVHARTDVRFDGKCGDA